MKLVLPDLVSPCPVKWSINPSYDRVRVESAKWIESFGGLTGRKGAVFNTYNLELLMALVYPDSSCKELKICCDFNNMVFFLDELSDHVGGAEVSPSCQKRFLASCEGYLNAVSKEADFREVGHILHIDSYATLRRENSGIRPFLALIEHIRGMDLPDEVYENPVFMRLYWLGVDLVWLTNDLYSFSAERAKGLDGNNFLSVVMKAKKMSIQEAADFTGNEVMLRLNQLLEDKRNCRHSERMSTKTSKSTFFLHTGILATLFGALRRLANSVRSVRRSRRHSS